MDLSLTFCCFQVPTFHLNLIQTQTETPPSWARAFNKAAGLGSLSIPCYKVRKKNPVKFKKYLRCCLLISWLQPRAEIATFPEQGCSPGNVSPSAASNRWMLRLGQGVAAGFKPELGCQHCSTPRNIRQWGREGNGRRRK